MGFIKVGAVLFASLLVGMANARAHPINLGD